MPQRWIRNSPELCEVCGNAGINGFCCESHLPRSFLIPPACRLTTQDAWGAAGTSSGGYGVEAGGGGGGVDEKKVTGRFKDLRSQTTAAPVCFLVAPLRKRVFSQLRVRPFTGASVMAVFGVCRAGAQQVCPLLAIPPHLAVGPAMFIHAHCVLHGGTPGLFCTRAGCPVCCVV